ncbi:phosphoesterase family protein [Kordia algicida OT-1]|uniref:Phosphoesterase family protein n=1 Tax=Kordia algicida OT-1 TaxID=391587 RepID=A9DMQ2_9FLAO|nr:phosphoesterase family protein [Kordia algicida OT-1]
MQTSKSHEDVLKNKIKHVVVVMFENRSFDHMLGFLYKDNHNKSPLGHDFEGLTGNETNPDSTKNPIKVFPIDPNDKYAYYMPKMDPGEGYMNTNFQLFGALNEPFPHKIANNQGFVRDFENKIANKYYGDPPYKPQKTTDKSTTIPKKKTYDKNYDHSKDYQNDDYKHWYKHYSPPPSGLEIVSKFPGTEPKDIMGIYTPELLPILSGLAKGYAVCDHYYCSVPSETLPNRAFMHMATSEGHLYDEIKSYSAKSIFKNLSDHKRSWGNFC